MPFVCPRNLFFRAPVDLRDEQSSRHPLVDTVSSFDLMSSPPDTSSLCRRPAAFPEFLCSLFTEKIMSGFGDSTKIVVLEHMDLWIYVQAIHKPSFNRWYTSARSRTLVNSLLLETT